MPGIMNFPVPSIMRAPAGACTFAPASLICVPSITTVALGTGARPVPSINVTPRMAMVVGACACGDTHSAAAIRQNASMKLDLRMRSSSASSGICRCRPFRGNLKFVFRVQTLLAHSRCACSSWPAGLRETRRGRRPFVTKAPWCSSPSIRCVRTAWASSARRAG